LLLNFFSILRRVFCHLSIFNFCSLGWCFSFIIRLLLNNYILISFFVFTRLVFSVLSYRHNGSSFLFVFLSDFLKLSFNSFLKRIFFILFIKINNLLFFNFWLRIRFLSCISRSSWIHIWWSIHIFESDGLQNRFDASYFRRNLFTFLLHFFNHFKNLDLELFLLRRVTEEERSFLWQSSIFLALVIIGLQHILLHSIHHKLIEHFREVWLLASSSSRHARELNIVIGNILALVCFEITLLDVVWSLGAYHVSIYFFVV